MNTCIIGIGSNIDAERNIEKMLEVLKSHVEIMKVSSMMKTKAIGITDQADFLNGATLVRTTMDMKALKKVLRGIEDSMGRDRSLPKFGPRCIDLDIVVWNNKVVDKDYYTREFLRDAIFQLVAGDELIFL